MSRVIRAWSAEVSHPAMRLLCVGRRGGGGPARLWKSVVVSLVTTLIRVAS